MGSQIGCNNSVLPRRLQEDIFKTRRSQIVLTEASVCWVTKSVAWKSRKIRYCLRV